MDSSPIYFPGTRVLVFDSRLFRSDNSTPLSHTIRPATVVRWYGRLGPNHKLGSRFGPYDSLIDVVFDHDSRESRSHFASETYVTIIQEKEKGGKGINEYA